MSCDLTLFSCCNEEIAETKNINPGFWELLTAQKIKQWLFYTPQKGRGKTLAQKDSNLAMFISFWFPGYDGENCPPSCISSSALTLQMLSILPQNQLFTKADSNPTSRNIEQRINTTWKTFKWFIISWTSKSIVYAKQSRKRSRDKSVTTSFFPHIPMILLFLRTFLKQLIGLYF